MSLDTDKVQTKQSKLSLKTNNMFDDMYFEVIQKQLALSNLAQMENTLHQHVAAPLYIANDSGG